MKHFVFILLFAAAITPGSLYAQKDTVDVPDVYDTGTEGTLNDAVQAAIDAGTLSNTVFRLKPAGLYVLSGTITTPAGGVLEITAADPTPQVAPPMIAWTASTAPSKTFTFDVPGNVKMNNIWLLYAGVDGAQVGSSLRVGDSAATVGGIGGRAEFDNVIFDYSPCPATASGAVEIYSTHFVGKFTNCYFRNCIDSHLRYYGRALSFRYDSQGLHADSVSFENCTFANMGYVYMQEKTEYGDNVRFNHCTFYNVVQFTLESGWWWKMYVTNSLFVNTYMYGYIPANATVDSVTGDTTSTGAFGGTIAIDSVANFGFAVPFGEQDRRILFANNAYCVEPWLTTWMNWGTHGNPYSNEQHQLRQDDMIPQPQPIMNGGTLAFFDTTDSQGNKLFPYMNSANLYDGLNPRFVSPPINMDSLKQFLYHKWYDNANVNWAFQPDSDVVGAWPIQGHLEDLSYANDTLKTAAMGNFPLGDLYHWWPSQYATWKAQNSTEHSLIMNALENGDLTGIATAVKPKSGNAVPSVFTLGQNYPNPFNPTTQINYYVPKNSFVTLKVYNVLGQEMETLFAGNRHAGSYTATFDGSKLASGVYFYRLQSGNVSITKKLVLMK